MKMIARMFCAAALVLGAFSLVGCDAKKDEATKPAAQDPKTTVSNAQNTAGQVQQAAQQTKEKNK